MASATLEPFGEQSEYAEELLDLFVKYLLPDEAYVARLKRHYGEVKQIIQRNPPESEGESNPSGNRAAKRALKKGRGKKRI